MSACASLVGDTGAKAGINRPNQALLAGRIGAVNSHATLPGGPPDQNFRESLQAQLGTSDVVDTAPEMTQTGTGMGSAAGPLPPGTNALNPVDLKQLSAQVDTDNNEPAVSASSKFKASTRVPLTARIAEQKQLTDSIGHKAANRFVAGGTEQSALVESTNLHAVNVDVVPFAIAPQVPVPAAASPVQQLHDVAVSVSQFDVPENNLPPSVDSIPTSITDTGAKATRETPLSSVRNSSSTIFSTVARNDVPNLSQEAIDKDSPKSETDRAYPDREQALRVSGTRTGIATPMDEAAKKGVASSDLPFVSENHESSLDGTTESSNKLNLATLKVTSKSAAEDQVLTTREIGKSENGEFVKLPPGTVAIEPDEIANRPVQSHVSPRTSASTPASESRRTSRSSSTPSLFAGPGRLNSNMSFPSTADALAARSLVLEGAQAGSATPKITDAISSDNRLQDTFAALEPSIRNESGTSNWARGGHAQAESGYLDPELGWIGVRAEVHAGGVHATLVSQSSDAAQALSGHIAGLHTYLAENRTHVETIAVSSFGDSAQQFTSQDSEQGMYQGSGQDAGHGDASPQALLTQLTVEKTTRGAVHEESIADEVFIRGNSGAYSSGLHISVLA